VSGVAAGGAAAVRGPGSRPGGSMRHPAPVSAHRESVSEWWSAPRIASESGSSSPRHHSDTRRAATSRAALTEPPPRPRLFAPSVPPLRPCRLPFGSRSPLPPRRALPPPLPPLSHPHASIPFAAERFPFLSPLPSLPPILRPSRLIMHCRLFDLTFRRTPPLLIDHTDGTFKILSN